MKSMKRTEDIPLIPKFVFYVYAMGFRAICTACIWINIRNIG